MANTYTQKLQKKAKKQADSWLTRILTVLVSLIFAALGSYSYSQTGNVIPRRELLSGTASFHFIDVGQGDATLILTGNAAVLVDTGPSSAADTLAEYVRAYTGRLDYLILTHPHDDHTGGVDEILDAVTVERILMPLTPNNSYTEKLQKNAKEQKIPFYAAEAGTQYTAGDITLTLLGPVHTDYENLNNVSAVIRVDVGGTSLLLSGDAEQDAEADILAANNAALLDCDIYQVGHHGSSTSTSMEFFTAIAPDHCIISCAAGNSYGHPHTTVLQLLTLSGAQVYRTDTEGTIVLDTDGETITRRNHFAAEQPAA